MKIEYIESVICAEEMIEPAKLHTLSRKLEIKDTRSIVMYFSIKYGNTQAMTACYFDRDHATALNAHKSISNYYDTNRKFREKIERYDKILNEGVLHKADYLTNVLKRLRKETDELCEQLKSITI